MSESERNFRSRIDPSQDRFELGEWPFYHLARLTAIYHQRMDAALKPLGVDVPRWRVLKLLQKQKVVTITGLSTEAVTKISTMAKIVQRMTGEGLVQVQPSAEDARSTEVVLTPKGEQVISEVEGKVGAIARLAFHDISDDEIKFLNALSKRIYSNLSV